MGLTPFNEAVRVANRVLEITAAVERLPIIYRVCNIKRIFDVVLAKRKLVVRFAIVDVSPVFLFF